MNKMSHMKLPRRRKLADQDREPDLDLIEPRGMVGREVKGDAVTGIAAERRADHT